MLLAASQGCSSASLFDFEAQCDVRCLGCSQRVGVVSHVLADTAAGCPPIAQGQPHRVIGLARQDHGRGLESPAIELETNDITVADSQLPSGSRAQERCVAPGELRDWVW